MFKTDMKIDIERHKGREEKYKNIENQKKTRSSSVNKIVWEDRDKKIENLKGGTYHNSETGLSSEISSSTLNLGRTTYSEVLEEDVEARFRMDRNLYMAARQGNVDSFITALQSASAKKQLSIDEVLCQMSPIRNTCLHIAASLNNVEIVELIARHFPRLITKKNLFGHTALHLAARAGHLYTIEILVKFWKDFIDLHPAEPCLLRIRNEKGNTALHEALMNSHDDVASYLIDKDPEGAFYLNNEHESPLYLAAKGGYRKCVSLILNFQVVLGKTIEQVRDGKSPIHAAIMSKETDVLEVMLPKASELLRLTDEEGRFPLHYAASMGYPQEVHFLLDKFAACAMERDEKEGFLPIHWASSKGNVAVIRELLRHCPHPEELLDRNGRSILHLAALNGKYDVLTYILNNPIFEELINMKDKEGNTPLHLAAEHFHPKAVFTLTCDSKVDLNSVNDKDMTAFDAALSKMENASTFHQVWS